MEPGFSDKSTSLGGPEPGAVKLGVQEPKSKARMQAGVRQMRPKDQEPN